jgi:hypothetical protein
VAQIGVVFFHEADHPVVAEADLLELVLGEVIGLALALSVLVEAVEAGLGELLALPPRPLLHSSAKIRVSLDAARRRPSALLVLLLAAPCHAQDTILAVESGDSWVWEGEFGEEEADLLELVLGEVIGLALAISVLVEEVEAVLGELLALPPRPLLHSPAEIRMSLDAARRRPSALLLLLLAAPCHAQDTILAVESGIRGFGKVSLGRKRPICWSSSSVKLSAWFWLLRFLWRR